MTVSRAETRHENTLLPLALDGEAAPGRIAALGRLALRYGASAAGPIAVSGAHFLASLVFLRNLSAAEFGLFSFAIVAVSFGMSMTGALVSLPVTLNLTAQDNGSTPACFKFSWAMAACFAVLLGAAILAGGADASAAALMGLFAALFAWRWFARSIAYVQNRMGAAIASDMLYAALLIAGLGLLVLWGRVGFLAGSAVIAAAAFASLLPFGRAFFRAQLQALTGARLADYVPIFTKLTRWSLMGVILTEATVNAHAYIVTFLAGPGAFALLALGMLMMRPAALVQSALPDLERPAMARAIAARDAAALDRILRDFTLGLGAAWLSTVLLGAALLVWWPQLLLKKGYPLHDVVQVAALSAAILLVRNLRTPHSILLQAGGQFKPLARIAAESAIVSLAATALLLFTYGTVASLAGILLGDIVILARTEQLTKRWRQTHV